MGNVCGCVRGPKEECYVDPSKAPLSPDTKELRGRRYFQRKKKRKSEDFQPTESLRSRGGESLQDEDTSRGTEPRCGPDQGPDREPEDSQDRVETAPEVEEATRASLDSISKGVYVGEVQVKRRAPLGQRLVLQSGRSSSQHTTTQARIHGITRTSRDVASKDSLLGRKLLQKQLRRVVTFGAVEHTLRTLRGDDRLVESLPRIIWSSQVHRRRRLAHTHTCSGASDPSQDHVVPTQPSVMCASVRPEVQPVQGINRQWDILRMCWCAAYGFGGCA